MAEQDNSIFKLFGFELKRAEDKQKEEKKKKLQSIVAPTDPDGAGYVTASGSHYGQFLDMDGTQAKDNRQLILKYRGVAVHPEVDAAIEDIVNESMVHSENESPVELNLDNVDAPDNIKKSMIEEFEKIVSMMKIQEIGSDIFRSFYIDGRLYHHLVVNEQQPKLGIQDIRNIDATKVRKVKNIKYKKDEATGAKVVDRVEEFYIFQEKSGSNQGIKLSPDSVSYVTSGLLDPAKKTVLSYLHKALKPINQLRMMEDSLVIYRLARAPERRIFYIDVGNMPRGKSEAYMKDIMTRYRNKLVYDANTGEIKDDKKFMSMLEDFWLPRREGGRGTEISTLPGGQNLGELEDVKYFQKKLYKALNVPSSRLETETTFNIGRAAEITRDEVKFQKFIARLRKRFSELFHDLLKTQLILKGIISIEEWEDMKEHIQYDYIADNYFTELKEIEIRNERMNQVNVMDPYVGKYFSVEYMRRQVLKQTEQEIKEIDKQIESEMESGIIADPAAEMDPSMDPNAASPEGEVAPQEEAPQVDPSDLRRGEF